MWGRHPLTVVGAAVHPATGSNRRSPRSQMYYDPEADFEPLVVLPKGTTSSLAASGTVAVGLDPASGLAEGTSDITGGQAAFILVAFVGDLLVVHLYSFPLYYGPGPRPEPRFCL